MSNFRGQVQGFAVGAAVVALTMLGGQAIAARGYQDAPITDPAEIARAFGVNIVWDVDRCNNRPRLNVSYGCTPIESPNTIHVQPNMTPDRERYVVLHEIGHVLQFRLGVARSECEADNIATALGGGDNGFYCNY